MKLIYSIKIVSIFTVSLLAAVAFAGFAVAADLAPTGPYEYEIGAPPPQEVIMADPAGEAVPLPAPAMVPMMAAPPPSDDYNPYARPLSRTQRLDRAVRFSNHAIPQASGMGSGADDRAVRSSRDAIRAERSGVSYSDAIRAERSGMNNNAIPQASGAGAYNNDAVRAERSGGNMMPIVQGKPRYDRGQATEDVAIGKDDGDTTMKPAAKPKPAKPVQMSMAGVNGGQEIDYVAVNQSVALAARELGQAAGLRVVAGPSVDGTIRKRHFKGLFPVLMDSLAKEYSLFWFPDGGVIYVEPLADQQTKVVKLKNVSAEQLYEAMDLAGLTAVKNRVLSAPGDSAVRVIGPDSFQRVIAALMSTLEPAEAPDIKIISYGRRAS